MGRRPGRGLLKALLDTHVLLYWVSRDPRLTGEQRRVVEAASAEHPLAVSDITLWEVATLVGLGRIHLKLPLREWLEAATAPPLVRRVPISPAIAAEVANLPETFPRDPADRIITASARVLGATLLTQDRKIVEAGVVETL